MTGQGCQLSASRPTGYGLWGWRAAASSGRVTTLFCFSAAKRVQGR